MDKLCRVAVFFVVLVLFFHVFFVGVTRAGEGSNQPPEDERSSIVGSLFHFVGDVISFPFRLTGKAIDSIF
ncbi:MAG: hypothetical protein AB7S78_06525 [Candidatus Omnitrophota bacterium]